jgi:hypothetical protein
MTDYQRWACTTFLSPQSQFRNLKEALPQSQFCNFLRNVAPQPRNSAVCNFKSATWELQFRNFQHIFGHGILSIHIKKLEGSKISCYFPLRQVFFISRGTDSFENIFGWFLKPSWAEEKGLELAGDCGELRNCGSQKLKVCNRSSATF